MSRRLVFLTSFPLSRIFGEKVGADRFRELGFETSLLDISPQYYSRERLEAYYTGDIDYRIADPKPTPVESKEELRSAIEDLKQGDVVWHLSRFFKSNDDDYVFGILERKGLPYYFQHFDTVVPPTRLAERLRMQARMYRQKLHNRKLRPYGVVGSGVLGRGQSEALFPNSRFLSIPSVKVRWEPSDKIVQSEYILFVDENVEYAPDAKLLGYEVSKDVDGYYERMNRLFSSLEAWLGKPVVVAASGKYRYLRDRFQGRQLVYGKTLSLIQGASLVIGHMSLALEQCLVSEKPFILVEDQSFTPEKRAGFSQSLLNRLQRPINNTEVTKEILSRHAAPDVNNMRALVRAFLREDEANKPYHELVANDFKKCWSKASSSK
jgi:hypothetical protein